MILFNRLFQQFERIGNIPIFSASIQEAQGVCVVQIRIFFPVDGAQELISGKSLLLPGVDGVVVVRIRCKRRRGEFFYPYRKSIRFGVSLPTNLQKRCYIPSTFLTDSARKNRRFAPPSGRPPHYRKRRTTRQIPTPTAASATQKHHQKKRGT